MNFIIEKFLLVFAVSNLYLGTDFNTPRSDLIILNNGEEVKCKVVSVNDALVKAETKNGEMTIVREIDMTSARDIVETGLVKNKRYSGRIKYYGDFYMEMDTSEGAMQIKRSLVRKIIISQEPSYNL